MYKYSTFTRINTKPKYGSMNFIKIFKRLYNKDYFKI